MGYSREQRKVITSVIKEGQRRRVSKKVMKAAIETILVEANATNPNSGDLDSIGAFQQRTPWGSTKSRLNVRQSAGRFFDRAVKVEKDHKLAGTLAQAVQVSAFPERYHQRSGEAAKILKQFGGINGGQKNIQSDMKQSKPITITTGGTEKVDQRQAIVDQMLAVGTGQASGKNLLGDTVTRIKSGQYTTTTPEQTTTYLPKQGEERKSKRGGSESSGSMDGYKTKGQLVRIDGQWVNKAVGREIIKAKKAGWKGKVVDGWRSRKEQERLYGSGNALPVAVPGTSMHEQKGHGTGAVDVSDPESLAQILRKIKSPLKWAGAKDPPHFSYPKGGRF